MKRRFFLKVLYEKKGPYSDYDFSRYLPEGGKPGRWTPTREKLRLCDSGWHVTTPEFLATWTWMAVVGYALYLVEVAGLRYRGDDAGKHLAKRIRFIRRLQSARDQSYYERVIARAEASK